MKSGSPFPGRRARLLGLVQNTDVGRLNGRGQMTEDLRQ